MSAGDLPLRFMPYPFHITPFCAHRSQAQKPVTWLLGKSPGTQLAPQPVDVMLDINLSLYLL